MSGFERIDSETSWRGKIFNAGVERFRHADGDEVTREKVWHVGAVGILAIDSAHLWLTRQPRESAGLRASLEIPAGKLDVPGESPGEAARRELAEEIGKQAANWKEMGVFYPSPGFSDERVWWYLARELSDAPETEPDEDERIEIVAWPLDRIDAAISECEDAKSIIALLWLSRALERGELSAGLRPSAGLP
jgi:8-oxo-dGTP pyrophosphatase MutT (NUDIX family)